MSRTLLFITSNGAGLGHLTRVMAVARRLPESIKPVIFTLSQGAPIAVEQGYFVEYMYSAEFLAKSTPGVVTRTWWNSLLRDRLFELLELYGPEAVVFDGTHPYNGLVAAIRHSPRTHWIWSRRAMWRTGLGRSSLSRSDCFDTVIEPGDIASAADCGPTVRLRDQVLCLPPVYYLDPSDLLDREASCTELGLDPDRINAFVQLGAGNINDISPVADQCLSRIHSDDRVDIVFADSAISERTVELHEKATRIRHYPATKFARAFDLAISAAGYNTFHELIRYGVPTLFIPNTRTKLDDQATRARYAEEQGIGLCWQEDGAGSLCEKIERLLDDDARGEMNAKISALPLSNGAADFAGFLCDLYRP